MAIMINPTIAMAKVEHTFLVHESPVLSLHPLLVIILALVIDDVEESQLVDTLAGRHDSQPVSELLLLEELLGPVSCVSIRVDEINSANSAAKLTTVEIRTRKLTSTSDISRRREYG